MLYTRKGDDGKTKLFHCDQRLSKNSEIAEALGAADEINSLLGLLKIRAHLNADLKSTRINADNLLSVPEIIEETQQNLFIIQAILAGADKKFEEEKVTEIEKIIDAMEKEMPPIHSFFLAGGSEISALFDFARAVSRRAERRVVAVSEKDQLPGEVLKYMNRLSSLLYAVARWVNFKSGIKQEKPRY